MSESHSWLLPDGIYGYLPTESRSIECKRRAVLDLFSAWGFQFVMPPLVDYLHNLVGLDDSDLSERTFKFGDPFSGQLLGVRADITPQAAKIDALMNQSLAISSDGQRCLGINRLSYCGDVMYTVADNLLGRRSLVQCGAEVFGCESLEADVEIMALMVRVVELCGLNKVVVDVGHQGVLSGLLEPLDLTADATDRLIKLIERKAISEYKAFLADLPIDDRSRHWLLLLPESFGGLGELAKVEQQFAGAPECVVAGIRDVRVSMEALVARCPHVVPYFDLSEMRGFHYHTGLMFAAYCDGYGQLIAKGGRYEGLPQNGVRRSATGFSLDLTLLLNVAQSSESSSASPILACPPAENDASFWHYLTQLRGEGHQVLVVLPGEDVGVYRAEQVVEKVDGQWQTAPVG